jgi:hypothetical protein
VSIHDLFGSRCSGDLVSNGKLYTMVVSINQ